MKQAGLILTLFIIPFISCSQELQIFDSQEKDLFSPSIDLGILENNAIDEASGISSSTKYTSSLWVHNDSGGEPVLYLIDTTGKSLASFYIAGVQNRDWEDIAVGPGPKQGQTYIYLGDIGDNQAVHAKYTVIRIEEPDFVHGAPKTDTITQYDIIEYVYPDGARDAETLMVDPLSRDIYIISKRDKFEHIYKAAYPQNTAGVITLEKTGEIPIPIGGMLNQIVGGDISTDGMEVLLKSYVQVFYWRRTNTATSITELLQKEPAILPYTVEPQGEAIGFAADGSGYYTLSEKQSGATPHLYFYKREQ